ncbi:hypothetical protein PGQ11_002531 [Apiospora arundinis]|uniref:Mg2+ transporter n=1 Tax=Apiospora arundinis TaxID=335852 RepID=A0ABR2JKF4_9PEZI
MSRYYDNANEERRGQSPKPSPPRRASTFGIAPRYNTADHPPPIGGNERFRDDGLFEEPENIVPRGNGPSSREATFGRDGPAQAYQWLPYLQYPMPYVQGPQQRRDSYSEDEYSPRPQVRRCLSTESSSSGYDTDGVDDFDGVKSAVFSFKPARVLPSEEAPEGKSDILQDNANTAISDGHSTDTKKAQGDEQRAKSTKVDSALNVSASRYAGDAFLGGQHEAELTVVHDAKNQPQPLFRWMHMVQPILDFEDFLKKIEEIGSLSQAELHALKKLFTKVKREAVRPRLTREGKSVGHMGPTTLRVAIPTDESRPAPQDSNRAGSGERHITWVCIPYFSLETYTDSSAVQSETQFPIETLLQSRFARTSKAREKQQVVWQRGQSGGDECFHIAQLWCVIVDKSLLLTCGRMPSDGLMKGIITKVLKPPSNSPLHRGKRIYVSYYQAVVWSFSLENCSTWFEFTKSFHAFAPRPLQFSHRDEIITAKDWPRILNRAKYSSTAIILDLRVGILPSIPAVGILQPLDKGKAGDTITNSTNNETFHVFTWLDVAQPGVQGREDTSGPALVRQLDDIEKFLLKSTKLNQQSAYRRCNTSTRQAVHAYLETQGQDIDNPDNTARKNLYSQRVDIYNAADLICQFFLPNDVDEDVPTVGKFWGAIMSFVKMPETISSSSKEDDRPREWGEKSRQKGVIPYFTIHTIQSSLRLFSGYMIYFQGIFNHIPAGKRRSFRIQDALVRAWMHLLMGLIMSSKDTGNWSEQLDIYYAQFRDGAKDIISQFSAIDLVEHAVMQPLELVSLLSLKLIQDSTDKKTDLTESYFKEVEDLECEIRENPDRSHQSRISWIKEEISIIQEVVQAQKSMVAQLQLRPPSRDRAHRTFTEASILKGDTDKSMLERAGRTERDLQHSTYQTSSRLRTAQITIPNRRVPVQDEPRYHSYNNNDDDLNMGASLTESFKLSPTDPNGLLGLLLGDCQTYLERRDGELSKLNYASSNLLRMNANQIDSTKDRQEAAVYAFTMVTIVFLPLGTISSIFGMNVSDIANLELSQWVFWATALPVTALVIITGLWWMGELRNLVDWLHGRLGGTDRGRDARRRGGRGKRSRTPSPLQVRIRYPMIADYYR